MNEWKLIRRAVLVMLLALGLGCESTDVSVDNQSGAAGAGGGSVIVDGIPVEGLVATIRRQPNMNFFADALDFTTLEPLLNDQTAAFTVTVPTDAAFNSLSNARRATLLANPDEMRNLLLRHIAPVVRSSEELLTSGLQMLDGSNRSYTDTLFAIRDVTATNGTLHGINTVYDTPTADTSTQTITQALSTDGRFSGLLAALRITDLTNLLDTQGASYTLFAPTNAAFVELGQARVRALYNDLPVLSDLLQYHVVTTSALNVADFGGTSGTQVGAANGSSLSLANLNGSLVVDAVAVLPAPIVTTNGVIYVIETVLSP